MTYLDVCQYKHDANMSVNVLLKTLGKIAAINVRFIHLCIFQFYFNELK